MKMAMTLQSWRGRSTGPTCLTLRLEFASKSSRGEFWPWLNLQLLLYNKKKLTQLFVFTLLWLPLKFILQLQFKKGLLVLIFFVFVCFWGNNGTSDHVLINLTACWFSIVLKLFGTLSRFFDPLKSLLRFGFVLNVDSLMRSVVFNLICLSLDWRRCLSPCLSMPWPETTWIWW